MNEYTPDGWFLLKLETPDGEIIYKLFASKSGGYLDRDYWRINSGITKVVEDNNYYYFYGYSGSVYKCHKRNNHISAYNCFTLNSILEKPNVEEVSIEQLKESGIEWEILDE